MSVRVTPEHLTRDQVLAQLKSLPSLPAVMADLLASMTQEEVDVEHLARQISRDQALTARVLRVANSSFYGLQKKVGSINDAVVVLGFRAVRSMVLAVGMNGVLKVADCPGFNMQAYFRHGVGVALAARSLAQRLGLNADLAFTAGLLHDIGRLVLAANFSAQYAQVLAYRHQHDCPLILAERDLLGLDHAVVGGLLAEAWHFPDALRAAVVDHHSPASAEASSLADLIHVADATAHALGLTNTAEEMVPPVDRTAWGRLRLNAEKYAMTLPRVLQEMEETCQALSV